jgi:hypothetical protein
MNGAGLRALGIENYECNDTKFRGFLLMAFG